MSITTTWDETKPAGTRNPALGDDDIREDKQATRERNVRGGHYWPTASSDTDSGKHVCGEENLGQGGGSDGIWRVLESQAHASDRDTPALSVNDGDHATDPDTVIAGDGVDGSRPYAIIADTLTGKRLHTAAVSLPTVGAGARCPGVIFINRGGATLTILETMLTAFAAPSGGVAQVDVLKITGLVAATNVNTAGTTIYATNREPEIASGEYTSPVRDLATDYVGSAFPTLGVGDAIVFEVDSTNSAVNLVFTLLVQRVS